MRTLSSIHARAAFRRRDAETPLSLSTFPEGAVPRGRSFAVRDLTGAAKPEVAPGLVPGGMMPRHTVGSEARGDAHELPRRVRHDPERALVVDGDALGLLILRHGQLDRAAALEDRCTLRIGDELRMHDACALVAH